MIKKLIILVPLILFTNVTSQNRKPLIIEKFQDEALYNEKVLDSNYMNSILSELKQNKEMLNKLNNK